MTDAIDPIETRTPDHRTTTPAERLRATTAASRLRFTWFRARKTLTPEQRAAAEAFGTDERPLAAAKALVDTKHAAYRSLTALRTEITGYWRRWSLPFPEPGVRLIKRESLGDFDVMMNHFKDRLEVAVRDLDAYYAGQKRAAAERIGSRYDRADHPETLVVGLFEFAWEFPSVEPPAYLAALHPSLHEREQARVRDRFEEAVRLAERAFLDELARRVGHLVERLTGTDADGRPKVFHGNAVYRLEGFCGRYRDLNVRSNPDLDELVEEVGRAVRTVTAQALRDDDQVRRRVATRLGLVQSSLERMRS